MKHVVLMRFMNAICLPLFIKGCNHKQKRADAERDIALLKEHWLIYVHKLDSFEALKHHWDDSLRAATDQLAKASQYDGLVPPAETSQLKAVRAHHARIEKLQNDEVAQILIYLDSLNTTQKKMDSIDAASKEWF